jgi:transposase InsO family protein
MSHRELSLAQKLQISQRAEAGESDQQIAQDLGVSKEVVRKWRRRIQKQGRNGLRVRRGRPKQGSLSSYPAALREQLLKWRQAHPRWGADSLLARLRQDPYWQEQALPDRSQIARFLKAQGLTRPYQRHSQLPSLPSREPLEAHQQWQLDAQAAFWVPELGWVILLNIIDVYSRLKVACQALVVAAAQSKAKAEDHQLTLRWAFMRLGLPEQLAVDHDSVYYDRSGSPFPTRLHLWLIALGVELVFGRFAQPTDQAEVERMHQLMTNQSLVGASFPTQLTLQAQLDQDLLFVNTCLPCRSLEDLPPLLAHPQAAQAKRWYRPEAEAHLLDLQRVYAYLAQGHWFRLVSHNGWISLGTFRYKVGSAWAKQQVEITFDSLQALFLVKDAAGTLIRPLTPKGLSLQALMGEAAPVLTLPSFQLALPFEPADWRRLQLLSATPGTISCDPCSGTILCDF